MSSLLNESEVKHWHEFPEQFLWFAVRELRTLIVTLLDQRLVPSDEYALERGVEFRNDVFAMRPDDCSCGAIDDPETDHHSTGCAVEKPNFACGDFVLDWRERIGVGMRCNSPDVAIGEIVNIFTRCKQSLQP